MSPDRSPDRPARGPGRLFTWLAALAVLVLAGAAFLLTYEPLRVLARTGGVEARWAPAYPVMADTLLLVALLALLVARRARWYSRLLRWLLLVVLLAGGGALAVQHAVWGYGSLPADRVKAGVAVAPHVMLVIAVWLWLTMIKHVRAGGGGPAPVAEPAPRAEAPPLPETDSGLDLLPLAEPAPALLPADVETMRARAEEAGDQWNDRWNDAPRPAGRGYGTNHFTDEDDEATAVDRPLTRPESDAPPLPEPETAPDARPEPPPALLPADVRTIRTIVTDAAAPTEPPLTEEERIIREDEAHHLDAPDDAEPAEDGKPADPEKDENLAIWDWNPPSSTFRSSPTPPAE
ncbi:DUF2637 domain-containing protein [Actinomadura atramentaria]|uniref:DUF2637 domain-containing protein n=1 Tax=Actinomadura atramentaria TaxID=1990 RepID=UPI0003A0E149|nr:DUF2637 domain-containing protein [Actinomadura atramentaria]